MQTIDLDLPSMTEVLALSDAEAEAIADKCRSIQKQLHRTLEFIQARASGQYLVRDANIRISGKLEPIREERFLIQVDRAGNPALCAYFGPQNGRNKRNQRLGATTDDIRETAAAWATLGWTIATDDIEAAIAFFARHANETSAMRPAVRKVEDAVQARTLQAEAGQTPDPYTPAEIAAAETLTQRVAGDDAFNCALSILSPVEAADDEECSPFEVFISSHPSMTARQVLDHPVTGRVDAVVCNRDQSIRIDGPFASFADLRAAMRRTIDLMTEAGLGPRDPFESFVARFRNDLCVIDAYDITPY